MQKVNEALRKQLTFADTTGFPSVEKFQNEDVSLPRSGQSFWLVVQRGNFASNNSVEAKMLHDQALPRSG